MSDVRTVAVVIAGRVQGVAYRAWTRAEAQSRGLAGHVRNRRDGGVEALFSGPSEAVEAMIAACRRGPPAARVDSVTVTERTEAPEPGFAILS